MNAIKFAELISYITVVCNHRIDLQSIEGIELRIKELIEPNAVQPLAVPKVNLQPMFEAMCNGRKIEAIKAYRELTGEGLKEAKDAIESIMRS